MKLRAIAVVVLLMAQPALGRHKTFTLISTLRTKTVARITMMATKRMTQPTKRRRIS